MRPLWFEATPAIAAAGHIATGPLIPFHGRRPQMSDDIRFALFERIDPAAKPIAYLDLDSLARAIQRRRDLRAIDMVEEPDLELEGRPGPTPAVAVWAQDAGGDRERLIGYAYLDGRGMDALQAALRRNPAVPTERAA